MIYVNGFKRHYYLIFANVIVDYKEQVLINGIKINIQCFISYIPLQKQENLIKSWQSRIHNFI